ncbi:MAG: beta-ketoacyl-ACP synthase III [Candidatus Orphnella occulta]|nr:beta-ketoacyl-ACP synthase III [Candidatus Orphnella occulta]
MTNKKLVGITGLGMYVPKKVLTNQDLEKMVDTSDEWITSRTGIEKRRIAQPGTPSSALAAKAAKKALESAKLKPEDIELIIVATITPDMPFPSTACFVQSKIGAKNAACFDIGAACSGFIYGLVTARHFIDSGMYKNALVIGVEVLTSATDYTDRNTCVLFGDGAGAAVLQPVTSGGILSHYLGADGDLANLLYLPGGGSRNPASKDTLKNRLHYIKMSGTEVFKSAVRLMTDAATHAVCDAHLGCKDISLLIPHQANIRIINSVRKRIGLPEDKVYLNVAKYGNVSAASTIIALCEAVKEKRIKKGDIVVLVAFGAGFTWGSIVLKW